MRVKFKVKHIVLYALLPLLLISSTVYILMMPQVSAWLHGRTNQSLAEQRTELLEDLAKASAPERISIIRQKVIGSGGSYTPFSFDVYIGSNSSQSGGNSESVSPLQPAEQIDLLNEYIAQSTPGYELEDASQQLVFLYDSLGQQQQADQALQQAMAKFPTPSEQRSQLAILQASRLLNKGDADEAKEVYQKIHPETLSQNTDLNAAYALLHARLLYTDHQADQALAVLTDAIKELKENSYSSGSDPASSMGYTPLTRMQQTIQTAIRMDEYTAGTIQGTLKRSDGTPVAGAGVFLIAEGDLNSYSSNVFDSGPYHTMTDAKGRYAFHAVMPGFYQLRLGLSFQQVDGWTWQVPADPWIHVTKGKQLQQNTVLQPLIQLKQPVNDQIITDNQIVFSWQPVKGAAYYNLEGGIQYPNGSTRSVVKENIRTPSLTITAEELYRMSMGFSYGSSGDFDSVVPESMLSFMNPNGRLSWNVIAYDSNGQQISQSSGYRLTRESMGNLPFFYLKNRTLTPADRILLDKNPEEALATYRQDVAANPQDTHALRMLTRLLSTKQSIMENTEGEAEYIKLMQRLLTLSPSSQDASTLADYYYRQQDWIAYNKYHALYLALNDGSASENEIPLSSYDRSTYAVALMRQNKLQEADRQFRLAMQRDPDHRFVGSYIANRLYMDRTLDSALALAEQYPQHESEQAAYFWTNLLRDMQAERKQYSNTAQYDQELQQKLGWYVQGHEDRLKPWASQSSKDTPIMQKFMKALLEVR
ncbi:carboxypeptidase-like regulatory domain-containing protein [Paenibacillus shenyangensis]|uniref:carboxypeptidase-like regulatory domain-containing protein n=1 Tax=Paenibacillus sp. A9 TaxID=1284352 RepID=UPI00037B0932|nr:carboxypeptidase-like regulatory domain-containing protein [Paenibacillus sp. A9]